MGIVSVAYRPMIGIEGWAACTVGIVRISNIGSINGRRWVGLLIDPKLRLFELR
jgi:hypothetical protein